MDNRIHNEVIKIERALGQELSINNNISLMTGIGGIPLFYALLIKLTQNEEYAVKLNRTIERLFELVNDVSSNISLNYASGLSGFGFVINFLCHYNFLKSSDFKDTLTFLDGLIIDYATQSIKNGEDIDFLHGKMGAAHYLLERRSSVPEVKLHGIFENLAHFTITESNEAMNGYLNPKNSESTFIVNCGLAHGQISNIMILSNYLMCFPHNKVVKEACEKAVNCQLTFRSLDENTLSSFPDIVISQEKLNYNIHLGWCYGDQTASLGLYKAAKVLGNAKLKEIATSVAKNTLKRNKMSTALFIKNDAGFCHGALGVAYLHKKWYLNTGDIRFLNLYQTFLKYGLEFGNRSKGIAGYQKFMGEDKYTNAVGLLDGVIGIGIVLIDYLLKENQKKIHWDKVFLIN